jgi:hypothetical protein
MLSHYTHVLSSWAASGLPEAPAKAEEILQRMVEEDCSPTLSVVASSSFQRTTNMPLDIMHTVPLEILL